MYAQQQPPLTYIEASVFPMCSDEISEKAAKLAREAYPDNLPLEERRTGRNQFINKHKWEIFDLNRDGMMSFDDYLSMDWAGYLAQVPVGECVVTKQNFLIRFLGDPNSKLSGWHVPWIKKSIEDFYASTDVSNKGYITKNDIRPRAQREFTASDRDHNGFITPNELP